MEGAKQSGSSFTYDLFGSKDSSASSSSRIFDSIFAPPAQVSGQAYLHPQESEKNCASGKTGGSGKTGVSGSNTRSGEGQSLSIPNKDPSLCFQEDKAQPFHYSSSIYYGGQDVYRPQSTQSTATTTFGKDGEEDDSGSASRGNWWQGSLYY